MTLCRLIPVLLFGACAAPAPPPQEAARASTPADPEVVRALDEASLHEQEKDVLFRRRFEQAGELWRASRLEEALSAVDHALLLRPGSEEALAFRDRVRRELGYRDADVRVLASDEAVRYAVRLEEEQLSVKRHIANAGRAQRAGDWDQARRCYEAALFILRTSQFREHADHAALRVAATERAEKLRAERIAAERAEKERATAEALREIERQDAGQ